MERLALIEVFDAEGRYQHAVPVSRWPVTVGRALHCDVVLSDPHVAAHHLTFEPAPPDAGGGAALQVRVGQTRNGVRLSAAGHSRMLAADATAPLPAAGVCHIGRSTLRVRLAADALADEEPIGPAAGRGPALLTAVGCLALGAWLITEQWLQNEPGATWDKYLPPLLGMAIGVTVWSALWGLASKIFQRHFRFVPHLRVLLVFLLASTAAELVLQAMAYALGLPLLSRLRGWVEIALVAALLSGHVTQLQPERKRAVRLGFMALGVAIMGINGALSWRHHQRIFDEQFAAALPPPVLRLVPPRPVDALLSEVRGAKGTLEKRAREDDDADTSDAED